ncbi:Highly reducing polyketide synthase gloL [Pseudocercospora fuligena]|uniref:Highly reducing polyketide synthase gloL n=1 Tax=Pseudocercospora fuligena TaxID=685502 RepID=A0A8H6VIF7_9PEZI|nr:Highly reducing polyketide synthase gloL [Pseudocercospora fuligena]
MSQCDSPITHFPYVRRLIMNGYIEHTNVENHQAEDTTQHASQLISASAEPPPAIAIIGMGMRLPGGVHNADDFWKLLIDGKDGFGPMPKSRYSEQEHEDNASSTAARSKTQGYFLQDDIAHFDVRFFNIADRHAAIMDPQQRLLQEVAWECLENGGQTDFRGKDIGCFVGVFGSDWLELSMLDKQNLIGKQVVGSQDFCLANQVSQVLEITGPSVTIKTGCSSSMTALHSACQALYSDECSAAIVAGSSLNLTPTLTDSLAVYRAVSAGGICKTFDADANGYGRGEAVNAILIKKLDDAMRDGDAIRAVIRATATNSDGRQEVSGAPKEEAQESVIRKAYAKAGIQDFSKTAFVECHGTGTQKGDTTEAAAIASVFTDGIMIGAVKPNVGHSEGAAGITSIIKAVLALENKIIPPNIHMNEPNPHIPFESKGLTVPLKPTPFPRGCAERISVCSMGAGGSNVHHYNDYPTHHRGASKIAVLNNAREDDFDNAEISQPICTAIQIGVTNLIASWGVKAESSVGHSSGEIAAAYAAGALSMDVAITLSYYRGQTIKSHSPSGAMAAVGLSKELIAPLLTHGVTVACENSPRNVTIAGEVEHIDLVLKQISSRYPDALCKKLNVKTAYHSTSMKTAAAEYAKLISDHVLPMKHTMKPMYSSSLGRMINRVGDLDATYWRETMTAPVLFSTAVSKFLSDIKANTLLLEIGPHAALLGPIREILNDYNGDFAVDCIPSLTREEDEAKCLLTLAGQLYARQVSLDLSTINGPGTLVTNLPPYSWDHDKRYWYESRMSRTWRNSKYPSHELLGSRSLESTNSEPSWRNCINIENVPWILDHNVAGEIVFPCAGYICMLGEAIRQKTGNTGYTIRELFIRSALVLQTQNITEIVTGLKAVQLTDSVDSAAWYDFTVSSFDGKEWRKHCVGQIRGGDTGVEVPDVPEHPLARRIDTERWYNTMADHGLKYGDSFKKICDISCSPADYEAIAKAEIEESVADTYVIHPTLMDQVFQLSGVAGCKGLSRNVHTLGVPISIEEIQVAAKATSLTARAAFLQARDGTLDMTSGGTMMATSDGKLALYIKGARFFPLKYQPSQPGTAPLGSRVEWRPYIDLLPSSELVSPSEVQTKQIGLIIKMVIMAAEEWSDSMGMGVASLSSAMRVEFDELMGENKGRIREILQSILPLEDEWPLKPGASRPKYLKDVESAIKGSDAALKPMRVFLETFLEMMEGKIPFMTYAFLDRGVPTVYDFTSTVFYLGRPLSLMGHANPSLKDLEIGTKRCGTTAALLSCLHSKESVALFSKFVFATGSSKLLEEANEMFGGIDGFESRSLELKEDFIKQGLEENSFDFIMAPYDLPKYADFSGMLARIMKVLTPGGRLIIHEITPPVPVADYFMATPPVASLFGDRLKSQVPYPKELWTNALAAQGFEDIYSYTSADYGNSWSAKVSISSIKPRPAQTPGGIDLICLDRSHEWVQNVDRRLRQAGYKTQLHTMHTVPDAKTDVIVLVDVEEPFLKDISKEDYDGLIKYMSQRRRTLWITRPAQITCSDPSQGLVLGLARTARFESGHDFATLEVNELNDCAAKAVVKVYHKLTIQPSVGKGAPDVEFALQDGVVHVPRYHWMPLTQSGRENTTSLKSKNDEKMALSVGSPPSLETLHWKAKACLSWHVE